MTNKSGSTRAATISTWRVQHHARDRFNTVRSDKVTQTGVGLYYEKHAAMVRHLPQHPACAGLLRRRVRATTPRIPGRRTRNIISPKLNFIFGPFDKTEYFLNYGQGFHATTTRHDDLGRPAPALVKTRGEEIGVRTEMVFHACNRRSRCGGLPWIRNSCSRRDAGTTEASRPSLRRGIEWSKPLHSPQLAARRLRRFGVARAVTGSDPAGAGTYIPGAIDRVASLA